MTASEVKKLLDCSYSSLDNYVKRGLLKLKGDAKCRRRDYDEDSVYTLYDRKFGTRKWDGRMVFGIGNEKYEFALPREILNDVLDFINRKLKER
jgi:hypothetical protein